MNRLSSVIRNENITVPALVLFLILLAYGIFIPWMGYYWDDWPFAWLLKYLSFYEFIPAFSWSRPLLGPIFAATTALFGGHPLTWQIIGLITRFLLSLEVWFLLRWVFPEAKSKVLWVVFLFAVYPGYGQQWVAFTHVNQELFPLLFLLGSFLVTVWALRKRQSSHSLTALALVLQAFGLFATEYFFGLEFLRFLFILKIHSEKAKDRRVLLGRALKSWSPYLIVWAINAAWIFIYHRSSAYASYDIDFSGPALSPLSLVNEFINTFSLSAFVSWLRAFDLFAVVARSALQAGHLAVLVAATAAVFFLMQFSNREEPQKESGAFAWWAMAIGFIGIFAGRLPSWAAGFELRLEFDVDRLFVSIMLGASLFIIGLADLILKPGKSKAVMLSLLIGLSVSQLFGTAYTYKQDWADQREFYWELAWRMPGLKEDTTLVTYELPLAYVSDLQVTAPLTWIYAPDLDERRLPYVLLYIRSRQNSFLSSLEPGTPINVQYRTANFAGNASDIVVIYKEPEGCLRVLDPVYGNAETISNWRRPLEGAIPLSNLDLIDADAPTPNLDQTLFGPEPSHGWCYYYAKAELARQVGDWALVVDLYGRSQRDGLKVSMPVEYLPFIEAFALTGDTETAVDLSQRTVNAQQNLCTAVTILWGRVSQGAEPAFTCK